ncbi:MAG TPA: putative 2OG-Fe(II) oxygenase [Steroidobacteraceae bacterium]|jgi:Flp pilus assembly protein TadD|nr:putative 2OG-Fe(II) oxygenase [Steroidobacteraceae bacterium]
MRQCADTANRITLNVQNALDHAYELMQRGSLGEAEAACRTVLAGAGGRNAPAWTILGMVLREQARFPESEAAYRRALKIAPRDMFAHHNLGALLSQLDRAEEALAALDRAQSLGLGARELHINRGRTLMQLYRPDEAEKAYAKAVSLEPRDPVAQSSLAQLRYMRGDLKYARDIAAAAKVHRGDVGLQLAWADLQRRSGDLIGAEELLRSLARSMSPNPQTRAALASVLLEMGRLSEARIEASAALRGAPEDPAMIENLVSIELTMEHPDAAMPLIRAQRLRRPFEQRWIAYEATAARLLQDPLYRRLYDYERLVRIYELEPPPGWRSIAELNASLSEALRKRHHFQSHPLDQSLRNGSQTARSLAAEREPAIQALLSAFAIPIADYVAFLGTDPNHPVSACNRGSATIKGCWSVELRRNGFHISHVHPQGWISSAYYIAVPLDVHDTQTKPGWIKFGEPGLPIPGLRAEHFVQPRPGRLVLFPSYMWHGTNRILGDETRLTVAFDAVPLPGGK